MSSLMSASDASDVTSRPARSVPWVTLALLCGHLTIFAALLANGVESRVEALLPWGILEPQVVMDGQWWRLLTSTLLHPHPLHLAVNALVLVLAGVPVERMLGAGRFVLVYVVSALVASLASLAAGEAAVGSSGALYGVLGVLLVLVVRGHPVVGRAVLLAVLCLPVPDSWLPPDMRISSWLPPHTRISHIAHAAGFTAGTLLGVVVAWSRASGPSRPWGRLAAVSGLMLALAGGVTAYLLRHERVACAPRLARLNERLAPLRSSAIQLFGESANGVPRTDFQRPLDRNAPVLRIQRDALFLEGLPFGPHDRPLSPEGLAAVLEANVVARSLPSTPLYVVAPAKQTPQPLMAVLRRLPPAYEARLLVQPVSWTPIDPLPKDASDDLADRVKAIYEAPVERRSSLMASLFIDSNWGCIPLQHLFGRIAHAEPSAKPWMLMRGVAAALAECECVGVDVDAIEAGSIVVLQTDQAPVGYLPLRLRAHVNAAEVPLRVERLGSLAALAEEMARIEASGRMAVLTGPEPAVGDAAHVPNFVRPSMDDGDPP